jgi:hypothetical protein
MCVCNAAFAMRCMLCDVHMRFDECNAMFAAFAMRWCGMVCDECVYVMLRLLCDVWEVEFMRSVVVFDKYPQYSLLGVGDDDL